MRDDDSEVLNRGFLEFAFVGADVTFLLRDVMLFLLFYDVFFSLSYMTNNCVL